MLENFKTSTRANERRANSHLKTNTRTTLESKKNSMTNEETEKNNKIKKFLREKKIVTVVYDEVEGQKKTCHGCSASDMLMSFSLLPLNYMSFLFSSYIL